MASTKARGPYIKPGSKRTWVRCIGPAAKKNPDHGFWAYGPTSKYLMCERCLDKIAEMSRTALNDRDADEDDR